MVLLRRVKCSIKRIVGLALQGDRNKLELCINTLCSDQIHVTSFIIGKLHKCTTGWMGCLQKYQGR